MGSKTCIGLHVKYPFFFFFLMEVEFSGQFFEKYSNIKFRGNPSNRIGVVPCGRTDRHDESNGRSSHFCQRAQKTVKRCVAVP
jgi:hypothetical protein